jgi:hypothetical protein
VPASRLSCLSSAKRLAAFVHVERPLHLNALKQDSRAIAAGLLVACRDLSHGGRSAKVRSFLLLSATVGHHAGVLRCQQIVFLSEGREKAARCLGFNITA